MTTHIAEVTLVIAFALDEDDDEFENEGEMEDYARHAALEWVGLCSDQHLLDSMEVKIYEEVT